MGQVGRLMAAIAGICLLTGGCSQTVGGSTSPIPPSTTASSSAVAAVTDRVVCASLTKVGKAFYERTYTSLIHSEKAVASPIELAAQLGALATTGAADGGIDGTAAISQASPDVREKLSRMVRDADRLAQHYADAARGAIVGSDLTPIVDSFTDGLIACTKAGYQPSWFDPQSLVK